MRRKYLRRITSLRPLSCCGARKLGGCAGSVNAKSQNFEVFFILGLPIAKKSRESLSRNESIFMAHREDSTNKNMANFNRPGGQRGRSARPSGPRPDAGPRIRKGAKGGEDKAIEVEGTVSAVLAGTMFKVKMTNGHEVLAHISGKMRKRFIRLVVGDVVRMEMSPYDTTKARIVFRVG
jgi:translation initiation factor IF-1